MRKSIKSQNCDFGYILQFLPPTALQNNTHEPGDGVETHIEQKQFIISYKNLLKQVSTLPHNIGDVGDSSKSGFQVNQPNPKTFFQDSWQSLTSLHGLPIIPGLTRLNISETQISTFINAVEQPDLEYFTCKNTPLGERKHLGLMAKVVFGLKVNYVNGLAIELEIHNLAQIIRTKLRPDLVNGFIVTSINPIRLMDPRTRQRRLFFMNTEKGSGDKARSSRDDKTTDAQSQVSQTQAKSEAMPEQKPETTEKDPKMQEQELKRKRIRIEMMKIVLVRQKTRLSKGKLVAAALSEFADPAEYAAALPKSEYQVKSSASRAPSRASSRLRKESIEQFTSSSSPQPSPKKAPPKRTDSSSDSSFDQPKLPKSSKTSSDDDIVPPRKTLVRTDSYSSSDQIPSRPKFSRVPTDSSNDGIPPPNQFNSSDTDDNIIPKKAICTSSYSDY